MARLLADANFPKPAITELRRLGHDAIGLDETDLVNWSSEDSDVVGASYSTGRALLTLDQRIVEPLAGKAHSPGAIVCAFDLDFIGMARRIDSVLTSAGCLEGKVIRVGRQRAQTT
jgi:hypothetical protein